MSGEREKLYNLLLSKSIYSYQLVILLQPNEGKLNWETRFFILFTEYALVLILSK